MPIRPDLQTASRSHLPLTIAAVTVLLTLSGTVKAVQTESPASRSTDIRATGYSPVVENANRSGTAVCGNVILETGEQCDDGNTNSGDGCSATCQVESGFACTEPVPPGDISAVPESGFESGTPSPAWTEFSTNFETPLCDALTCGLGGGTGAFEGNWWLWLGGTTSVPEIGFIEQTFVFPAEQNILTFQVENADCDSGADFATVSIDGNNVFTVTGDDPTCGVIGYRQITIDLATAPGGPYNTGTAHTLRVESEVFAVNFGVSNFFFDHFLIDIGDTPPQPSICTPVTPVCYAEDFDPPTGNGWTAFTGPNAVLPDVWGNTADGVCGSDSAPPGNHAGTGVAACIDSDAAGTGVIDTYLCSDAIDLSTVSGAKLEFLYNYQIFGGPGPDDVFTVSVGNAPPNIATVGGYTQVFDSSGVNSGTFGVAPGAAVSIDVSDFDGGPEIYLCYRYGGDFDWYGQVDDVVITANDCNAVVLDNDGDGVPNDSDNCTNVENPLQEDVDGDGHGNICDADFDQDCSTNFADLSIMRAGFFAVDPLLDLDSSGGSVNFADLQIARGLFFQPPGPSAAGSLCD